MTEDSITNKPDEKQDLFDSHRWGLPLIAVTDLANRLRRIWSRFRGHFTTRTHDTSEYAFIYLRGLLTMDTKRNYANIARRVINLEDDGQNLQQFMSDSPWPSRPVFGQVQTEINQRPELVGGMLTLDESGDKRSGSHSANCQTDDWASWKSGYGTGGSSVGLLPIRYLGNGVNCFCQKVV
jgi:hypothetical protein